MSANDRSGAVEAVHTALLRELDKFGDRLDDRQFQAFQKAINDGLRNAQLSPLTRLDR